MSIINEILTDAKIGIEARIERNREFLENALRRVKNLEDEIAKDRQDLAVIDACLFPGTVCATFKPGSIIYFDDIAKMGGV